MVQREIGTAGKYVLRPQRYERLGSVGGQPRFGFKHLAHLLRGPDPTATRMLHVACACCIGSTAPRNTTAAFSARGHTVMSGERRVCLCVCVCLGVCVWVCVCARARACVCERERELCACVCARGPADA